MTNPSPDSRYEYHSLLRASIPLERLLRALLLQGFYTIHSERQLMEQLDYNLLYCWSVGSGEPVWGPTVFTKNRDRLLDANVGNSWLLLNYSGEGRLEQATRSETQRRS